jgi:uncharacterized membrane protein
MGIHIHLGGGHYRGGPYHHGHEIKSRKGTIIFGIIFILITTLIFGGFLFFKNRNNGYVETTGIVIDQEYARNNTYRAVAEYEVGGIVYTVRESASSSFPPEIGSEVVVLYNPHNPADADIKTSTTITLIIYGIFAIFYIAGICVLIKGFRMPKDEQTI